MQYALMFYENPSEFAKRADSPETEAYWASWMAYSQAARESGVLQGGQALEAPGMSTALRLKSGAKNVQDGPIADTKEQLGGFFIIDVPNLDDALEWAAKAPCAGNGGVEVRPVMAGRSN